MKLINIAAQRCADRNALIYLPLRKTITEIRESSKLQSDPNTNMKIMTIPTGVPQRLSAASTLFTCAVKVRNSNLSRIRMYFKTCWLSHFTLHLQLKQDRHCTNNVTLEGVRICVPLLCPRSIQLEESDFMTSCSRQKQITFRSSRKLTVNFARV